MIVLTIYQHDLTSRQIFRLKRPTVRNAETRQPNSPHANTLRVTQDRYHIPYVTTRLLQLVHHFMRSEICGNYYFIANIQFATPYTTRSKLLSIL